MVMHRLAAIAALLIALMPAATTDATQQGDLVIKQWKAMDLCAQKAQAAFPDATPEANAKRDAQLQACLQGQNLPPREPLSPHQ
jgi:hypothetical protein